MIEKQYKRDWTKFPDGKNLMHLEYLAIKARVAKGARYLQGKWLEPGYEDAKFLYTTLTSQMLEYEIENGLLPI